MTSLTLSLGWGQWPYLAIFIAAVFEGEIVYIGACVLAGMGHLNVLGVWFAGALGGSAGDQLFFYGARYAARSRLVQRIGPAPSALVGWVRNRAGGIIMASRFLPGLRIAIPVGCAYAGIDPVRFSLLSVASGVLWAGTILFLVTVLGPHLRHLGLPVPLAMAMAGVGILLVFAFTHRLIARRTALCNGNQDRANA